MKCSHFVNEKIKLAFVCSNPILPILDLVPELPPSSVVLPTPRKHKMQLSQRDYFAILIPKQQQKKSL